MNGNERRLNELVHPENTRTDEDKARMSYIMSRRYKKVKSCVFNMMVINSFVIVAIAASLHGWIAVITVLGLTLANVITAGIVSLDIGNKVVRSV